jgi:hypothetical protein
MLATMTTDDIRNDGDEWARGRFEPCENYQGDADAMCLACGWLAGDHEHDADVVALPQVAAPVMRRAS